MANDDGNGCKNADPLLQYLMSPTLFPLPEHSDVDDVVNPMLMSPSEFKNRLIFGPFPSSSATTSLSDFSTLKPKPTHHGFSRSRSAPSVAAVNDGPPHPVVDHILHRSYSTSKSTVTLFILYLSAMTVATVVYGDQALKTLPGWLLAAIWLIVSTLAVSLAFYYLAEAIRDKRNRVLANRVLAENMSISHFLAADIDHNGYVRLSEYVLYKLKQMQKITDKDIRLISDQFYKMDRANSGKITLSDLLKTRSNDLSTAPSV